MQLFLNITNNYAPKANNSNQISTCFTLINTIRSKDLTYRVEINN
jgi:hypothetical protein